MDNKNTKGNKRINNLLWLGFEKFGLVFLSAISFFVFAIYLTPTQLGLAVIAIVFAELVASFFNATIETPLVRRQANNCHELSSAFWLGSISAVVILFLIGALYLVFDKESSIGFMILVLSVSVLTGVMARPFVAKLRFQRKFKVLALRTVWGKVSGALLGIIAAIYGAGEWSLIIQLITMNTVALVILMFGNKKFIFQSPSLAAYRSILIEGIPIGLRILISGSFERVVVLILATLTSPEIVGYFSFAKRLVDLPKQAVQSALNTYSLPVFAEKAQNKKTIGNFFIKLSLNTSFILIPVFLFYGYFGSHFIVEIFGEKWRDSMEFFIFFALITGVQLVSIYTLNLQVALSISKLGLYSELLKSFFSIMLAILLGVEFGVYGVFIALLFDALVLTSIRFYNLKRFADLAIYKLIFVNLGLYLSATVISLISILIINFYGLSIGGVLLMCLITMVLYFLIIKLLFKMTPFSVYSFIKNG